MPERDLTSIWSVLETEASRDEDGIEAASSGVAVGAGETLVGVDGFGRRHLLIPLRIGEAFAEDRSGRSVHLLRVDHGATTYLSAVNLNPELDAVFAQFCNELLDEISEADSPAQATVSALDRWRRLFSEARGRGLLTEPQLVGLLGELLMVESIVKLDPGRRIEIWSGPTGSQHDLRRGNDALEVKATLVREGRVVHISSVDQLEPPTGGSLHLAHYRFEPDPSGESVPEVIDRISDLGVEATAFGKLLGHVGYQDAHADEYTRRRYRVVELRVYDVAGEWFPRIVPGSFVGGNVPPGTLRISYSIDLSNEPPGPIGPPSLAALLEALATS